MNSKCGLNFFGARDRATRVFDFVITCIFYGWQAASMLSGASSLGDPDLSPAKRKMILSRLDTTGNAGKPNPGPAIVMAAHAPVVLTVAAEFQRPCRRVRG
jgi:hypothetical protein